MSKWLCNACPIQKVERTKKGEKFSVSYSIWESDQVPIFGPRTQPNGVAEKQKIVGFAPEDPCPRCGSNTQYSAAKN